MISTAPKLTTAGTSLLIRALAGEAVTFTGFKIGNGDPPDDPSALTDLVNPLMSFGIDSRITVASPATSSTAVTAHRTGCFFPAGSSLSPGRRTPYRPSCIFGIFRGSLGSLTCASRL